MKIYERTLEATMKDDEVILITLESIEEPILIDTKNMSYGKPKPLAECAIEDKILLTHKISEIVESRIYTKMGKLYVIKEQINKITDVSNEECLHQFSIENHSSMFLTKQVNSGSVGIFSSGVLIHTLHDFLSLPKTIEEIEVKVGEEAGWDKQLVSVVKYLNHYLFVTLDPLQQSLRLEKVLFNIIKDTSMLALNLLSENEIEFTLNNQTERVNFSRMKKGKKKRIFSQKQNGYQTKENIVSIISIDKTRYYVYARKEALYFGKSNHYQITGYRSKLLPIISKKNVYLVGRHTHYAHNAHKKYETLYLHDKGNKLANFRRPFASMPLFRRYGYFKFPLDALYVNERIHNNFFIGDDKIIVHNLKLKNGDRKVRTAKIKKNDDQLNIIRTNLHGNVTSTIVPFTEEYKKKHRLMIYAARCLAPFMKIKKKKINLFFEKKSSKADESGYRVFEKVVEENVVSKNFFVIDSKADAYQALKEKYGKRVVEKYSFRHYLLIFMADALISSELPNHLLNDRLYIDKLRDKIMRVPLIFLQHGIMFAKPVDNPMAMGFHKQNNGYNIKKCVISSELEAGEFYKMGYEPDDLLLTGLATFDHAYMKPEADKIAYMPTYRYWEEGLIYKNEIESTSYYKSIMGVIRAFEKDGLIDRLLIVPHNKFSQYIYENMPEYKHLICDNPSEALRVSKIFITDYSSAIYDAVFRGAFPIFYWEEKDYLIEKYQAIPPVNEKNAPGPIAYNANELLTTVKVAIENDYEMSEIDKLKYKAINSFDDRKNTERIVSYLREEKFI